jgi:hypothetical protein
MHAVAPLEVVEVALHGLADAALEGFLRRPAEFALDLAGVDGSAQIVAGAVGGYGLPLVEDLGQRLGFQQVLGPALQFVGGGLFQPLLHLVIEWAKAAHQLLAD